MDQQYSSILLENAVNEFAKLPGIGGKRLYVWFCIC